MINLELLQELVAFQKYGTLSATAEHLLITQPTVTRGMRKLEQELGVTLFDRSVSNHITLNDTGILAANEAKKLLQAENSFTEKILNYDRQKNEITVASITPGPIIFLKEIRNQFSASLQISSELVNSQNVGTELQNYKERLIFNDHDLETPDIESMYLGIEQVNVGIDQFNPLAQKKSVTFKDLQGLSFLVVEDIGPWRKIIEDNIPKARFLYQENLNSMSELSRYSHFPFFFSNLTQANRATTSHFDNDSRRPVKIKDPNNKMEIYGSYLKNERKKVQPVLKKIIENWPK